MMILRKGIGVTHILSRFGFSSGTLLPVAIAEVDGQSARGIKWHGSSYEKSRRKAEKIKKPFSLSNCVVYFYRCIAFGFPKVLSYPIWKRWRFQGKVKKMDLFQHYLRL